jgi:hypothetical protein
MRSKLVLVLVLVGGAARAQDLAPPPAKPLVLVPRWPSDRRPLEITASAALFSSIPLSLGAFGLWLAAGLQCLSQDFEDRCGNRFNPLVFQLGLGAHAVGMFSLTTLSTGIGLIVVSGRPYSTLASARAWRNHGIALVVVGVLMQAGSIALDVTSWSGTREFPDNTRMGPAIALAIVGPMVTGAGIACWVRGAEDVRHAARTQVSASLSGLTVRF